MPPRSRQSKHALQSHVEFRLVEAGPEAENRRHRSLQLLMELGHLRLDEPGIKDLDVERR